MAARQNQAKEAISRRGGRLSARSAQRDRSRAGVRNIAERKESRPARAIYACAARGAGQIRRPRMEAGCRAPAAGRRYPVRQQDRRDARRDGRSRFEARDRVARVFDQGPSLRPAADHDRGGVQGRRHRQGRRGLAACDEAARPEGCGHRAGPGRPVFSRLFRPGGGEGPQAG